MMLTDVVGYSATLIGTFLMIPQVVRAIRTKHMDDVSAFMAGMYIVNCALWGWYGYLLHSTPMILCNSIALGIGVVQAGLKWKYTE